MKEGTSVRLPRVQTAEGTWLDLEALAREGWLVLFFYPKSGSPGCTLQARRYAALAEEFRKLGAHVLGVSAEPQHIQCAFSERVRVRTVPDPAGHLASIFGVGRFLGHLRRDTVVVNHHLVVEKIWRGTNPLRDADRVLAYLKATSHGPEVTRAD
ncbi:Putative peroxiredoxin [bacterium HR32]|nr:Putative peroxiredoxin [bacterium HR32]